MKHSGAAAECTVRGRQQYANFAIRSRPYFSFLSEKILDSDFYMFLVKKVFSFPELSFSMVLKKMRSGINTVLILRY